NDFIEVKFTTAGGAIDHVALLRHKAVLGQPAPYTLNQVQVAPALSLLDFPGVDKDARYELVSHTDKEVVYRTVVDGKLEVARRYTLLDGPAGDAYQIRHETTFRNLTDQVLPLPRASFSIGTAAPLNENDNGIYLNVGYYDGDKAEFVRRDELAGGGFFSNAPPPPFVDKTAAIQWAAAKNQFFAMILTPDQPGTGVRIERVKVDPLLPVEDRRAYGIAAAAQFELKPIAAGASLTWGATYFAGPKEYKRLSNADHFKHSEDLVMQFSTGFGKVFFSGFFSPLLLTIMNWVHTWVPNWGLAIIVMTILLKVATLPFTLAASRSAKRMQKLMPLMTELREKYKDNPAKMQEQTMKLYKDHKVNPLGGCIPILITMPFFIGFFTMLQSSADLRFASFLWVKDLAAPDTVVSFGYVTLPLLGLTHLSINLLPIILGVTNFFQIRITPTPSTDPTQATMMKIMPWMFMLFCYNFAAALSIYSTMNGLLTILQQWAINRLPEPQLATPVGADGLKNVTPRKKK
ncbi:MAG TPA: YidC/Oxa1 family insertase periplasmic-domain containing protein, partial [Candidatus Didemnitutus sp.]|nr:YidC/Oxa1 family insertase periplasmic-domain containing protein [Candidatus Didemnitutus sp.]